MAYDEYLADRISQFLKDNRIGFYEKKMMGGLIFMVDNKMCIGIVKQEMMARIDPDFHKEAIKIPGCRTMDFTNRPMKGYVLLSPEAVDMDDELDFWIEKALEYNPKAKSSTISILNTSHR